MGSLIDNSRDEENCVTLASKRAISPATILSDESPSTGMNPAQEGEVHTSIEVTCENGHTFRVKRKYVGRQGKCPECSASVLVPKMADTQGAAGGELETLGKWSPQGNFFF